MKRAWWICLLLFIAASASALEVKDVQWGFDGKVVPDRFNVLSVLVVNPSMSPFDGTVNLYKTRGMEQRIGALYGSPCYVSPMMTRWVQFYVYIENQYDDWRLEWGRDAADHSDVPRPTWGPPARVLLSDPEMALSAVGEFKQFPEDLFPPTGAATDGLDILLLDHAPRWEAAKRQAFLNWLRAGGKVHVLFGADGQYPVFSDELSVLNSPQDQMRIGAGLVVRHAAKAVDIRTQDVEAGALPLRQFKSNANEPYPTYETSDSFFRTLVQLNRRHYDWGWIFLLAVVYVGLIGPGNLLAGRKLADYRLRILLLLATVGVFAWIFNAVGRRGQGEVSVIRSLSYARAIDGDTYNVTQWIDLFATHGAQYTIQHSAPHNLYATGQDYETVNAWIDSGKGGQLMVDIPMFSRRALLHQGEMKGANIPVEIVAWDGTDKLKELTLTVGPEFTKQIVEGWVVQGNQVYGMRLTDGRLEFRNSDAVSITTFLKYGKEQQQPYVSINGSPYGNEVTNVQAQYEELVKPLIGWGLRTEDLDRLKTLDASTSGQAQLFLFARSPESFCLTGSQLGHETGYVLYRLDLFKPGT
jgi:hypothetical protein